MYVVINTKWTAALFPNVSVHQVFGYVYIGIVQNTKACVLRIFSLLLPIFLFFTLIHMSFKPDINIFYT